MNIKDYDQAAGNTDKDFCGSELCMKMELHILILSKE